MSSSDLKNEFWTSARRSLEEFTSTILSTFAAKLKLGQGVSCFCPEKFFGVDECSAFFFFGQLLDGNIECDWREVLLSSKAAFKSFVREQRQLEGLSIGKRPDVGDILAYCLQQTGF